MSIKAEQITQALREQAREDIPDTMNLIPDIHARLHAAGKRGMTSTTILLITVFLMLGAGTAAFALVTSQINIDPGITGAAEADLVTTLGLSQFIGDVEVRLEWAYADAHRVAIGYSVLAPEGAPGQMYFSDVHLRDEAGSFVQDGAGAEATTLPEFSREAQSVASYGVAFDDDAPETLNMLLDLAIQPMPDMNNSGGGGSGGGSGYGGGTSAVDQTGIRVTGGVTDPIGTASFSFELPWYRAITLNPNLEVTSGDITMTLESLSVTPSSTNAQLCSGLPDGRDWRPRFSLEIDGIAGQLASEGLLTVPNPDDQERCRFVSFNVPYDRDGGTLSLTADGMETWEEVTEERVAQFVETLAAQGVTVRVNDPDSGTLNYEILEQPDGDVGQIIADAMRIFEDRYEGSWTFTVEIPAYPGD